MAKASYPHSVAIDDQCDACGIKGGLGIIFGVKKPVICLNCIGKANKVIRNAFWVEPTPKPAPAIKISLKELNTTPHNMCKKCYGHGNPAKPGGICRYCGSRYVEK